MDFEIGFGLINIQYVLWDTIHSSNQPVILYVSGKITLTKISFKFDREKCSLNRLFIQKYKELFVFVIVSVRVVFRQTVVGDCRHNKSLTAIYHKDQYILLLNFTVCSNCISLIFNVVRKARRSSKSLTLIY